MILPVYTYNLYIHEIIENLVKPKCRSLKKFLVLNTFLKDNEIISILSSILTSTQSLRELILKNEFVETIDKYPATHTHLGTQKQLTVKSKRSGFRKKWHISIKKNL